MIVKNESHIIEKTLKMLTETLDFSYWVISDTGSTDNTKKIIKSFFKNLNIPGELVEHEWRDFGYNRTKALESAYNKTDYLFIFDADDWIYGKLVLPELNADMYNLKFGNKFIYKRPLLVNNRLKWKFIGVLHEYIACNELKTQQDIKGEYYIDSGKTGARSQDPQKYIKDALVLENAHKDETDQGLKCRYAFYCAQSYMDANMPEKSIEWYKKVVEGNNWNQEKYYSCLMMANMYFKIDKNEEAILYLSKGDEFDMQRIEHVHRMMDYYYKKNIHLFVNLIYEKYKNYKDKPINYSEKLFLSMDDYNYKIEYLNSISAYYTKNFQSGYQSSKIIINSNDAPEYITKSTMLNFNFYKGLIETDTIENIQELFKNFNKKMCHDFSENNCNMSWNNLYNKINFTSYNSNAISKIKNKPKPKILLSMTTCKRFDLFEKTINSIFNQWEDYELIDYWFLVDDNSSKEDTDKMRQKYPFFDFYFKKIDEKGHRKSMNIIFNKLNELNPQYWIHLEDDFLFYDKMKYIITAIKGLKLLESDNVKQILFNFCYAETINDYKVKGFIDKKNGFFLHDYQPGKRFNYPNSQYWPHYSFRPSLIDVSTILKLGIFDSENQFFEMDYAHKWTNAGYKSAFFDKITNKHIGRLTSERHDKNLPNAYELNNENQFHNNKNHINNKNPNNKNYIKIINLERRTDRKNAVIEKLKKTNLNLQDYEFIKAIDGLKLTKQSDDLYLFKKNDFGNRRGFIGCALSHYYLWKQLLNDNKNDFYLIMEDDFTLCDNFKQKIDCLNDIMKELPIIFLGFLMFEKNRENVKHIYDVESETIKIEKLNKDLYIGGMHCYSINKIGAKHMLNYISQNGIKHGIDYVIGKLNPEICYESQPHLAFAEWCENNKKIDTDIQNVYDGIELPDEVEENGINNNIQDNFIFIPDMDQLGNDLYYNRLTIQECMKIALSDVNCKGFNTLGFFKSKIEELKPSGYFRENIDGLYIKKNILENNNEKYNNHENISLKINELQHERYIRIKMLCNWCSSEQLCKEWSNMCDDVNNMSWKQIKMTSTNNDNEIDYYVIINKPYSSDIFYDPKRTIIFQMEPWVNDSTKNWGVKTWGKWAIPSISKFMEVRGRKTRYHNNAFWQLELSLNQIKHLNIENKLNKIASICSEKYFDEGHVARIDFLKYIEKKQLEDDNSIELDIYNQNNNFNMRNYKGKVTPYIDKSKGILPYKYYFMIENNYEENFITEKLWEPILCETLCFYYGCPNVTDYINKEAFVLLPINDFEKSYQIMKQSIKDDLWSKRIEIIRQEKQKILNELSFFPVVESIINKPKNVCFIHCCSMPGKEKRLGYLIEKLISSKLINVLDKIYINNIGLPISVNHDKIDVNNYSTNNRLFELPTLNKIRDFSIENNNDDINILYLHNKGISYDNDNQFVNDWIDMMLYFLVEQYENCITILNDKTKKYHTVGCNYYDGNETIPKHFSGNFWWAKSRYLQRLPKFEYTDNDKDDITLDKLSAEFWLFKENPKYYNLHSSDINHFHETYPKNKYCL